MNDGDVDQPADRSETVDWGHLRELVALAPLPMAVWRGPRHAFIVTNPAYDSLVNVSGVEGRELVDVFPQAVELGVVAMFDAVFATGESARSSGVRSRLVRRQGGEEEEAYFDFTIAPVRATSGRVVGIVVVAVEVTAQILARRNADAARARFAILAEVNAILDVSTDHVTALGELARLLARTVADFVTFNVRRPDGSVRRVADAGRTPELEGIVRAACTVPPASVTDVAARVLETGAAVHFVDYDAEVLARLPEGHPYAAEARRSGVHACSFLALRARGRALGFMTIGLCRPGEVFAAEDVSLVEAIAARAGLAMDNARLLGDARAERARLQQIFTQLPLSVTLMRGPDHEIELVNPISRANHDMDPTGMRIAEARPFAQAQGIVGLLDSVFRTGEPHVGVEAQSDLMMSGQRVERFWDFFYQPMRNLAGEVDGILSVSMDVTERVAQRKQVDAISEKLRDGEELLRAAFENAAVGMALTDLHGALVRVNPAYCELVGRPAAELLGRPYADVLHDDDRAANALAFAEVRRGDVPSQTSETRYLKPDGTAVWGQFTISLVRDGRGEPRGVFSIVEDSTERNTLLARERAARAEAEAANQLKDQFLATVSHELRTPLNAVLGWLSLLKSGRVAAERHGRALDTIERNAKAQVQLVEDLLDVSRIMSGKLTVALSSVDLAGLARAEIDSARPAADAKGVALEARVDDGRVLVSGDAARLRQVIANLLGNAIKFTPKGGAVTLVASSAGDVATLEVRDTGRGIAADFLPLVFERFRQGEGGTTRAHGGLGIGLAIVKSLVELHHGSISAASEGPGRGASFLVELPRLGDAAAEEEAPPSWAIGATELAGVTVLVIDDDRDARDVVGAWLKQCGAVVAQAASVAAAWALVDEQQFDVVLTDIAMPVEDGYALLRRIRARAAGGQVPVVALTAHARPEDRARALRAGFDSYVPKPVQVAELVAVIANLVARSGRK